LAKKFFIIWLGVLTNLFLISCQNKKDLSSPATISDDYFPLAKGQYAIYDVVETRYDLQGNRDSVYQLKVALEDAWVDLEGGTSFKMYRYKKPSNASKFILDSIQQVKKVNQNQVLVTENNVPFLKLSLPLVEAKTWNGNMFNTFPTEKYTVSNLGKTWGQYPNTVTIIHKKDFNLVYKKYRVEVYGKDVGLVYKESQEVNYSTAAADFGKYVIADGKVYKQTLTGYGKQ
jgi:hypothetical protein